MISLLDNPVHNVKDKELQDTWGQNKSPTLRDLVNARVTDFDSLVDEIASLLYTHFEVGILPGNLPQLWELEPSKDWGEASEWLAGTLRLNMQPIMEEL